MHESEEEGYSTMKSDHRNECEQECLTTGILGSDASEHSEGGDWIIIRNKVY
jgi:hypothetical protein